MLSRFLKSIKMSGRVIKSAIMRPLRRLYAKLKRLTNVGRRVQRAIPKVIKKITTVKLKPEKREDYVDLGQVYVAKSLFFIILIAIVLVVLLCIYVIAPWFTRLFGVEKLYFEEDKALDYTGEVILFSDENKKIKLFEGELENGIKTGKGLYYYESGNLMYEGDFADSAFSGDGIMRFDDGSIMYEGNFAYGEFDGAGSLYDENGTMIYEGEFADGVKSGKGTEYSGTGKIQYDGMFDNGQYHGVGKTFYANGKVKEECITFNNGMADGMCTQYSKDGIKTFEGIVSLGKKQGLGTSYYETGEKEYVGDFFDDLKSGQGTLYYPNGRKKYDGEFLDGIFDGEGSFYVDGKLAYEGSFLQGEYFGDGTIYLDDDWKVEGVFIGENFDGYSKCYKADVLIYEGETSEGKANGQGKLYNAIGDVIYEGGFANDFIDSASLISIEIDEVRSSIFADATLIETEVYEGFMITNKDASLSVWCNYGYGGADIVSHRVFFYKDTLTGILKGEKFEPPEGYEFVDNGSNKPLEIPNLPEELSKQNDYERYGYDLFTIRFWGYDPSNPDLIEWRSYRALPETESEDSSSDDSSDDSDENQESLDDLLSSIGLE